VDGSGKSTEKGFDFSELQFRSTGDSMAQQRVRHEQFSFTKMFTFFQERFDKVLAPLISQLKTKYPIGNHPLFPEQRVYKDVATGWFYDLTEARLNIWASHIVCHWLLYPFLSLLMRRLQARDAATLDTLPQSNHFNHNTCIRPKKSTQLDTVISTAPPLASDTTALAPTISAPLAAAVPAPTTSTLLELMMLQMLQQQQQNLMTAQTVPVPIPTIPAASAVAAVPLSDASASLNAVFHAIPAVPLAEFCARYRIDEKDKVRLEKLEFQPGDDIDLLSSDEWKENAGFAQLSWTRIKGKNQQFLRDVQMGKWNGYET